MTRSHKALLSCVCLALIAALLAGASSTSAAATPGRYVVTAIAPGGLSPSAEKIARATCNNGSRLLGGGGYAKMTDFFGHQKIMLTKLQPVRRSTPDGSDYFEVAASAGGWTGQWRLFATAICGTELPGMSVVSATSTASSATFRSAAAACPAGRVVLGTGAEVKRGAGQVGLQLSRAAGPLDISRATAREDSDGYSATWTVTSYAICVSASGVQDEQVSANVSTTGSAIATCRNGHVHSVGGGGSLTDSGPYWLQEVRLNAEQTGAQVVMTGAPQGGTVASAVCVR